jgi:uncharacterized protein YhjY with autotransporter beta-barrel domain
MGDRVFSREAPGAGATKGRAPGAWLVAVFLLLGLLLRPDAAWADTNNCTLTAAQIPSLQVVRGSTNNLIIDTSDSTTRAAMIAACGDLGIAQFQIEDITDTPEANWDYPTNPISVTLSSGSTFTHSALLVGQTSYRRIHYSPSATAPSTDVLSRAFGASHSSASLGTMSNRTIHFYQPNSALGIYFSAQVTIVAPNAPTAALTSLNPATIYAGGTSAVTVTLTNPNGTATLTGVADTITLPSGVTIAATPGASTTCGGSMTATAGAGSASLSGGSLAPGASCTITFNITSTTVSSHTIPSGTPSATGANAGSAGTTATLTVSPAPNPPTIAAAFSPVAIGAGGNSTLTLTITNPNSSPTLTGVAVAAAALPANLAGSGAGTSCTGGTAAYNSGTRQLSLSGATVAGSGSCTVTLTVTSTTPSTYSYTTGVVSATGPVALTGTTATTPTALTVVGPPTISVAFSPTSVAINSPSTLTLTLTNPNGATALTGVAVAGAALPAGLSGSGAATSCGGTPVFSGGTLSLSGGSLAAGGGCAVTLSVQASAPGTFNYTSGAPSASGPVSVTGTGAAAPTALTVTQAAPTITSISPTSGTTLGGTSVTITGTGFTNVTAVTFGGTAAQSVVVGGATTMTAVTPAHAAGPFDTVITTAGGSNANSAADDYTFVAPPAAPTVTAPTPSQRTNNNMLVYSGSAGNNLQVEVHVDGSLMGTTTSNGAGAWSLAQSPALADGSHSVHAIAVASGVRSTQSTTIAFVVDTAAPAAPTVTAPVSGSTTNDNTPTFTGTTEANSVVRVFIGGSFAGNATVTSTNWSYTPTTLADGSHNFWATATDVAGNLSPQSATGTLIVDTTPPPVPAIDVPAAGANTGATPTISGTAEANATVTVTVDSTTATTAADGSGAWSLVWASLAAGSHTASATARDAALNVSAASAARSFTVVNAPVASSFTYGSIVPYNIGGDPPTTFSVASFATNSPTSYAVGSATTTGGGSVSIDNAGQVSYVPATGRRGSDSFTYTATNAGGTSAPATVTITVGNPTFAFTLVGSGTRGSALSGVQINMTGGKAPYSCGTSVASGALPAGTSLNNDCTITGTPTASGSFTFKVTAVDSSTGTGPFTQTSPNLTLIVATPTLTIATNAPTGAAVGDAYSQTNSASGGDTPYTYALASGALPAGTTLNAGTGTVSGTPTTVGAFSYTIKVTDSQTTPATATGTLVSGTIVKGNQTTSFTSTAPAAATVGGATYTPTASATSGLPVSLAIDATSSGVCTKSGAIVSFIGAGTCTINADQPGNPNWNAAQQVQQSFVVGQGSQTIAFTSTEPGTATVGGATYTPTATATSGLAVALTIDPSASGVCTISGGVVSFTGIGTCLVNADQAGNADYTAAPQVQQSFAVGQGSQTINITSSPSSPRQVGGTYTPAATASSGLAVAFTIDPSAAGVCTVSAGTVSYVGAGICVVNADQAGNADYAAAPQVQQSFAISPGEQMIDFTSTPPSPAIVGGTYAPAATASSGLPVALSIDPSASGVCSISGGSVAFDAAGTCVVNADQAGDANYDAAPQVQQSFAVTAAAPIVSSVSPNQGPAAGGNSVTITGTNLDNATDVYFGTTQASSFSVISPTEIEATAPAGTGTVNVQVATLGGLSAGGTANEYAYVDAPAVTSISPSSGPLAGGTMVVLTGSGFTGATAVNFCCVPATSFTVDSDTQITAVSPARISAGAVNVRVTTVGGISATAAGNQFTYVESPSISGITPTSGPTSGGTTLTISGSDLAGATGATVDGVSVTIDSNTATEITITAPAHSAGTVDVEVTTVGGTSNSWPYTYVAAPTITSLSPSAGPTSGGNIVYISGSDLAGATSLTVDGAPVTIDANDGTTITITAPAHAAGTALVEVTTPGGATSATYTYVAGPAISGLSPQSGSGVGGYTITISGTDLAGATDVTVAGSPVSIDSNSGTQITITAPVHPGGDVPIVVTTAGGTASATFTYIPTPAVGSISPYSGPTDGGTTVTINGNGLSNPTAVSFGGTPAASFSAGTDNQMTAVSPPGTGSVAISVTTAGGTGTGGVDGTFAYIPPAPALTSPADGATVTSTPPLTGTALAGAMITIRIDGSEAGTTMAAGGGSWAFTPTTVLADGAHYFDARQTVDGQASAYSTPNNFTIDSAAPAAPVVAAPANGAVLTTSTPLVSGTAEANATVTVYVDGASAGTATADAGGAWSFMPAALADGAHSIYARAADAAGNASPQSNIRDFTIDSTAPAAPAVTAPANGALVNTTNPTIQGTAEPNAVVTVFIDGSSIGAPTAGGSGTWSIATPPLTEGAHSVHARAVDGAGNTSADSATNNFTVTLAPTANDRSGVTVPYDTATAIDLSSSITGTHGSIAISTAPAHGTTSIGGDVVTYTPAAGYHGPDSFAYTATGPGGTSAPATVSLTVATPAAPTAADRSGVAVAYDSSGTAIDLSGSIGGVHGSIAVASGPGHGTTSIAGDVVTYTPTAGYYGPDSFTYTATGPGGTSAPATVSLTVATPAAPTAADRSGVAVAYDSSGTAIDLSGSIGGVHSSIAVASGPGHGTTSVSGDVVTYVPATGYYGPDSFTYTATGPGGTSAPATVSLTVSTPPPPAAQDVDATIRVGGTLGESGSIDLTPLISGVVTDVEINTPPSHGTVVINASGGIQALEGAAAPRRYVATYTRAPNYAGPDSFTYRAIGPGGSSPAATVRVQVLMAAPTAAPLQVSVLAGRTITIDLSGAASNGPFTAGSLVSVTPSGAGDATLVEGGTAGDRRYSLQFTSRGDFAGTVLATYTLSNASATSPPLTVTITVTARPDPSADPEVRGLESAQTGTVRRFAQTQIANFNRRLEQLHGDGGGSGIALRLAPGIPMQGYARQYEDDGPDPSRPDGRGFRAEAGNRALEQNASFGGRGGATGRSRGYGATGEGIASEGTAREDGRAPAGDARAESGGEGSAPEAPASGEGGRRTVGSIAAWAEGAIIVGRRDPATGRDEFSITTTGISGGVDIKLAEGATVGVGLGGGHDATEIGDNGTRLRATNWAAALYGSFRPVDGAFVDLVLGFGGVRFDLTRYVSATGTLALSDRNSDMMFGALTAGIDRQSSSVRWAAYGGLEGLSARLHDYVEVGPADYSLAFDERTLTSLSGLIGARVSFDLPLRRALLTPRARAEFRHEFEQANGQRVRYSNWLSGPTYMIDADGWSRHRLTLSVGIGAALRNNWRVGLDLNGEMSGDHQAAGVRVEVSRDF